MFNSLDIWIIVTASLIAMACALPGTFLLLSKQSMMSHGISHAVLPGIVLAYLAHHHLFGDAADREINTAFLLVGAVVAGILCALLTKALQNSSRLDGGAALGISFTSLFAVGLILQRLFADDVHIEPSHVLWGNLEMAVYSWQVIPPAAQNAFFLLLLNGLFVLLFYKELLVTTFDPHHGHATHSRPGFFYYALITLSAITAVIAFEAVGSILVVAMMIIPPAIAFLLSKRLQIIIPLALGIGILIAFTGHLMSMGSLGRLFTTLLQLDTNSTNRATNSAAGMALAAGIFLLLTIFMKRGLGKRKKAPQEKRLSPSSP